MSLSAVHVPSGTVPPAFGADGEAATLIEFLGYKRESFSGNRSSTGSAPSTFGSRCVSGGCGPFPCCDRCPGPSPFLGIDGAPRSKCLGSRLIAETKRCWATDEGAGEDEPRQHRLGDVGNGPPSRPF